MAGTFDRKHIHCARLASNLLTYELYTQALSPSQWFVTRECVMTCKTELHAGWDAFSKMLPMCQSIARSSRRALLHVDSVTPFIDITPNDVEFCSELCNPELDVGAPSVVSAHSVERHSYNHDMRVSDDFAHAAFSSNIKLGIDTFRVVDGQVSCAAFVSCPLPACGRSAMCSIHDEASRSSKPPNVLQPLAHIRRFIKDGD